MMFAGEVNLRTVTDAKVPFRKIADVLRQADVRFTNLECMFYDDNEVNNIPKDGFQASPAVAEALRLAGFDAVGTANNGNYGDEPILLTLKKLDALGIKHTGSGANSKAAHEPAIVDAKGVKVGMLQRTAVYWPMGHEAGEDDPGVAAFQVHTSYRIPMHRAGLHVPPLNRPGIPPEVVTTIDPRYLDRLRADLGQLRSKCDVPIASIHWGFKRDVLSYMTEIAHAAIDAGAAAVIGHGPHHPMAIEVYKGCPIFYSLSSFSFNIGHRGQKSGNWLGEMARVTFDSGKAVEAAFRWVRHSDANETYFPDPKNETAALEDVSERSKVYGTKFTISSDEVLVAL
jgi:poly-gamma-glutamate synthesis protein (capsule biosynthesis protein)